MNYFFLKTLCLFLLLHSSVMAQSVRDTVELDKVTITKTQSDYYENGSKKQTIDSFALQVQPISSLSDILQRHSTLQIKSYGGNGANSSVSIRGAGASRTQINWEGFPINSLSAGDNDIGMLPSHCFNNVNVYYSGNATHFGSGTFGGAVELKNTPEWKKKFSITSTHSIGSFSTFKNNIGLQLGNNFIQYSGTVFQANSEGNFPYYDYISSENKTRESSDFTSYGTVHNIHIKLPKNFFIHSAIWFQYKNMNLPAIMGSSNNNEQQKDSSLKTMLSIKKINNHSLLTFKLAYVNDYLLYTKKNNASDSLYSIYSEIESKRIYSTAQYRYFISKKFTADFELQASNNSAEASNYSNLKSENTLAGILACKYKHINTQASISARQEYNSTYKIPTLYNIGVQHTFTKQKTLVRASAGNKYRTPTFNDLYWANWGNPNLIPESGYTFEIGFLYTILSKDSTLLNIDMQYFKAYIDNMIIWTPQGAIWTPMNYNKGINEGIEFKAKYNHFIGKWKLMHTVGLDITKAIHSKIQDSVEIEQKTLYTPIIHGMYSINAVYKSFVFSCQFHAQSARYYTQTKWLPSYSLLDISGNYKKTYKKTTAIFGVHAKNITNTQYELIRSYPMAGISFEGSIKLMYNK